MLYHYGVFSFLSHLIYLFRMLLAVDSFHTTPFLLICPIPQACRYVSPCNALQSCQNDLSLFTSRDDERHHFLLNCFPICVVFLGLFFLIRSQLSALYICWVRS